MFESGSREKPSLTDYPINRREMLLSGTTLAAASAIELASLVHVTQAQQVTAAAARNSNLRRGQGRSGHRR